jgi:chromosome segregation protein
VSTRRRGRAGPAHPRAERQAERRRRAEQRERVLRWEGEVSALRGSIAAAEAESAGSPRASRGSTPGSPRPSARTSPPSRRRSRPRHQRGRAHDRPRGGGGGGRDRRAAVEELDRRGRDLEARRSSHAARAEALRAALAEADGGTAALLDADLDGVLGAGGRARPRRRRLGSAVAAALGPLGEAVVVPTPEHARNAVAWLRRDRAPAPPSCSRPVRRPPGGDARRARRGRGSRRPARRPAGALLALPTARPTGGRSSPPCVAVLAATFVVADWDTAVAAARRDPDLTFVTPTGTSPGRSATAPGLARALRRATATAADEAGGRGALSTALARSAAIARRPQAALAARSATSPSPPSASTNPMPASPGRRSGWRA